MTEHSTTDLATPPATHDTVRASRPSVLAGSAVCVGLTLSCVLALALRPTLPAADAVRALWPAGALLGPLVAAYRLDGVWHRGVVAAAYSAAAGVGALLGVALAAHTLTHAVVGLPWVFTAATDVVPVFTLGAVVGGVSGSWLRDCTNALGGADCGADASAASVTITVVDVADEPGDATERPDVRPDARDDAPGPRARDARTPPTPGARDATDGRRGRNG